MRTTTLALLLAGTLGATRLPAEAPAAVRLGTDVLPTFEAIHLRVDPGEKEYRGMVSVDLEVKRQTDRFQFHARGETLTRVALTSAANAADAAGEIPLTTEADERGLVTARASRPLAPGTYHLEIAFTQGFNADARRAFPCWDEPGVKIPYQLTAEIPAAHLAVSNAPVASETPAGDWKTVVFERTPPLPAYLLAFASGPFEVTPIPGLSVPGRIVTVAGEGKLAGTAAELVPPLLASLERWFGRPYPFQKLDLIAAPEFWPGAMENPGAIVFAESVLLLDPKTATGRDRLRLSYIAAHELAHQWFGDLVTMAWWDDLWLNESFADWLAEKTTDEVYPQWKQGTTALAAVDRVMETDARPSAMPIRRPIVDPDQVLSNTGVVYDKGRAVLGMFETFLGPEVFRRSINAYLAEHAWGSATSGDLWRALGRAANRDVGAAMATFVDQPGLPLVRVAPLPDGRIALSQERFASAGAPVPPLAWKIPVGLKYGDGKGGVHSETVLLDSPRQVVALPVAPGWVMPDLGGAGYYRWSVPEATLGRIAADAARLDPRERIVFLSNLRALLTAGLLHGDTFLAAVTPFAADPEPLVVTALLEQLDRVRPALVPIAEAGPFAGYVRGAFRPVLDRIGREAKPGEDPNVPGLRSRLLLWLGDAGDDGEVQVYGQALARRYLDSPAGTDPDLAAAILELAAFRGDRPLFDAYRQHFETARTPGERSLYLRSLTRFRDPALVDEAMRYSLSGPLRPIEILGFLAKIDTSEAQADRLFAWMRDHYDEIAKRVPPITLPYLPLMASGCSAERLEQGRQFFGTSGRRTPGTERQLAIVADQVNDCLRLREREGPAVAAFLRKDGAPGR